MFDTKVIDQICNAWSPGNELEVLLIFPLNRIKFRKCLNSCIAKHGGSVFEDTEVLDITTDEVRKQGVGPTRYTIVGKSDIAAYCKTNKLTTVARAQTKKLLNQYSDSEFGFKVKLSDERDVAIPANLSVTIAQHVKLFRLKKRYSINTGNGFRLDFTIVKLARAKTLAAAALHQEKEHFEIEIEYLGGASGSGSGSGSSSSSISARLLELVKDVLSNVKGEPCLCSASEKVRAMDFYVGLVGSKTFAGPKPVTLELQHLLPIQLEPGIPTISTGYSVTEKADGESSLLIFNKEGVGYLVNRRLEIKATGITVAAASASASAAAVAAAGSVLDCEVISLANGSHLIMTFDCYFFKGKGVFEHDLETRLKHMHTVVNVVAAAAAAAAAAATASAIAAATPYKVRAKEFLIANDNSNIFDLCKQLIKKINAVEYEYNTDGLILTPVKLGVHQTQILQPSIGDRTWTHVLKWKPPKDNTIDFLVKVAPPGIVGAAAGAGLLTGSRSFNLYVGANCHTIQTYFESKANNKAGAGNNSGYTLVLFKPEGGPERMHVELDKNGVAKCKSGEEILEDYVVEVAYDADTKAWIPLRIRYDKIEEAKAANKITANALITANSVWYTIIHPVTERHITGAVPVHQDDVPPRLATGDAYYKGDDSIDRADQKMFPLAEFHNYWVKNQTLLKKFRNRATSLFDVSCGRAGDMYKWFENGFTTVVGVDISAAGIFDKKGVYARIGNIKEIKVPDYKYVFVPLDSGQIWTDQIENFQDDYLKKVARVTWGLDPSPTNALKHLEGIASKPTFDVVSCQFSLHYFFESEEKLENLIKNIDSVLAPGGHFICTCFGGQDVVDFLGDKDERLGFIDGKMVWGIRKEFKGPFKNRAFGQKINVFVEQINKWHEEYLVPFNLLEDKLNKYGIRVMTASESKALGFGGSSHGSFRTLFDRMVESKDPEHVNSRHVKTALKMTEEEKNLSFLNNWFVFVKNKKRTKKIQS